MYKIWLYCRDCNTCEPIAFLGEDMQCKACGSDNTTHTLYKVKGSSKPTKEVRIKMNNDAKFSTGELMEKLRDMQKEVYKYADNINLRGQGYIDAILEIENWLKAYA